MIAHRWQQSRSGWIGLGFLRHGRELDHHAETLRAAIAAIKAGYPFNSPDSTRIVATGLIRVQTDGDGSNEGDLAGMGNNRILAGSPVTGEIRRFLTGTSGSEVTGLTWSSNLRTMFADIRHPGAGFPAADGLPRSSIVAVWRDDGALIG